MKKYKNKIVTGAIIAIVLIFAFWYGGDAPKLHGWTNEPKKDVATDSRPQKQDKTPMTSAEKIAMAEKIAQNTQSAEKVLPDVQTNPGDKEQGMVINEDAAKDKDKADPVSEGKPVPVEPENVAITNKEYTCTLSVRCDTILNNIHWLDSEKVDIVPKDGVIFSEKEVTFYEGESVFNLLVREMKRNKIHMEFENMPIYNSAYIEGIANLYEFDCGELSGWMYKVNDWFPNYGCSRYQLKAGDKVEWGIYLRPRKRCRRILFCKEW